MTRCEDEGPPVETPRARGCGEPEACDRRLTYLLETSEEGFWDWDLVTDEMFLSPGWCRMLGYDAPPTGGGDSIWRAHSHPDDMALIVDTWNDLVSGRADACSLELRARHTAGHWLTVVIRSRVMARAADGAPLRIMGSNRDVTSIRAADDVHRRSAAELRETLDHLPIAVAIVSPDGRSILHNLACERMTGLPRSALADVMTDALPWAIFDESGRRLVFPDHEAFAPWVSGRAARGVVLAHFPVGADEPIWTLSDFVPAFDADGTLRHVLCCFADITVMRRIKASLTRTHRFEGLAHLAGAVAHDFNNLLATVLGSAEVVGINLPEDAPAREDLDRIVEAAQRGAALTHQLLAYARRRPGVPRVYDLGAALERMSETLRRLLGRRVRLEVKIHTEPLHVVIDPAQFEQLVSSLAVNAKEAMPDGGRVRIELDVALHLTSADGRPMVVLRVTDDGEGIPDDVLPHIFDPLFTTRHLDMGAGLGLATCEGIVRHHGGRIVASSRRGQGTTFEISLPRARRLPTSEPLLPAVTRSAHTGAVLLVETDPALRDMATVALDRGGYQVYAARDGAEAEELARRADGLIGLIVADELPDTTGAALAAALQEGHPRMATLFVRNSDNPAPATASLRPGAGFIFRPFGASELMSRIEALMASLR